MLRAIGSPPPLKTSIPWIPLWRKPHDRQETVTITLSGDYDFSTKLALTASLSPAETAKTAVIDFTGTNYIDCGCLSTLIILRKKMLLLNGCADIRLVVANVQMKRIFALCGFEGIFPMYTTVQEALQTA